MGQSEVTQSVSDHFRRVLGMFREALDLFPADEWRRGDIDYVRPAGLAYHVLESIDFYTGDQPVDRFHWGGRFGVDWEDRRSERLPSQEQVLAYLEEMSGKLHTWLETTDLLAPEQLFSWTGPTHLARAIYLLRNIQHHVAELCLELTRRGCSSPEWK